MMNGFTKMKRDPDYIPILRQNIYISDILVYLIGWHKWRSEKTKTTLFKNEL